MEHQRIDEGVKRGPRKRPGQKPHSPRLRRGSNGNYLPIMPSSPEAIRTALEVYCAGATLKQIGQQYGVTRQAIYGWLLGELGGEEHAALVTRSLTARIAKGDETLDSADNPLDLARGREQARNARLDLERRRAHLYGAHIAVTNEVVISDQDAGLLQEAVELLRLFKAKVIEANAAPAAIEEKPVESK